jgi:hypothetical protein
MTDQDFNAADNLIQELYKDVSYWETPLSGGSTPGVGTEVIDHLKRTNVTFGNPSDNLVMLTRENFEILGIELTPARQIQIESTHKFYLMTLVVNLRSRPTMQFRNLRCLLDFGPKGAAEPVVQTIFPPNKWRSVANWGGGLVLGLDGNLDWAIGLPAEDIAAYLQDLPVHLAAQAKNVNQLKAFIAVPDYSFSIGRFDVAAYGEGGSECYWSIDEPKLREMSAVQFVVVFKVPVSIQTITLKGTVWAEPKIEWLATNLRDVMADLKPYLQQLFRQGEDASSKLARGSIEQWDLKLPSSSFVS